VILKFLTVKNRDVNITVLDAGDAHTINTIIDSHLPGRTRGKLIQIEGKPFELNHALRNVYYYASDGTRGNVSFEIHVQDNPLGCSRDAQHIFRSKLSKDRVALLAKLNVSDGHCDTQYSQHVNKTIHITVIPSNRPPVITLDDNSTIAACPIDKQINLPFITITDPDNIENAFKDSYGNIALPSVTLEMSVVSGRIGIINRHGLSFTKGRGLSDKSLKLHAPLDILNEALKTLTYICRSCDGCIGDHNDVVTIIANDEGISGTGGALTDTFMLYIPIQALPITTTATTTTSSSSDDTSTTTASETTTDATTAEFQGGSPEAGTTQFTVGTPGYYR